MAVNIPDTHKDLLDGPVTVALATVLPNGQPHVTPVWCTYDGTYVIINTARGRVKDKNMHENSRVTILAIDPEDDDRYIQVQGMVDGETEEGAVESIEALAGLYTGKAQYFGHMVPDELEATMVRVIYKIKPTRVTTGG